MIPSPLRVAHALLSTNAHRLLSETPHRCSLNTLNCDPIYSPGLGTWRQVLPPMPGGKATFSLSFASSAGDRASIDDVLFGEVYLCSGQSNM